MRRTSILALIALSILVLHGCETEEKWEERQKENQTCRDKGGQPQPEDPFSNQATCRIPAP